MKKVIFTVLARCCKSAFAQAKTYHYGGPMIIGVLKWIHYFDEMVR